MASHTECFAEYGTKPRNPRWSWSARDEASKTVVVRLWQDRFMGGTAAYSQTPASAADAWFGTPGHREFLENLRWARDNCAGEVRVIIAIPHDVNEQPRRIKESFARPALRMRVTELDEATGAYALERV